MTQNQIRYWELQETKRANLAKEKEAERANLAKEQETHRANVAQENLTRMNIEEQSRHNVVTENTGVFDAFTRRLGVETSYLVDSARNAETSRHNLETEKETARHNVQSERIDTLKNVVNVGSKLGVFGAAATGAAAGVGVTSTVAGVVAGAVTSSVFGKMNTSKPKQLTNSGVAGLLGNR